MVGLKRTTSTAFESETSETSNSNSLPRPEIDPYERVHEERVRLFNAKFPRLDALMSSVLLKCPPELLDTLMKDPEMWKTPPQTSTVLSNNITVSDPVSPDQTPPSSPRSVLPNNF